MSDASALDDLREQVDSVDEQIVHWINQRAKLAVEIGKIKAAEGTPVYVPDREARVLDHVYSVNDGPLTKANCDEVYAVILSVCRQIQQ